MKRISFISRTGYQIEAKPTDLFEDVRALLLKDVTVGAVVGDSRTAEFPSCDILAGAAQPVELEAFVQVTAGATCTETVRSDMREVMVRSSHLRKNLSVTLTQMFKLFTVSPN